MNLYDQVKTYLENEPRFRERRAKNRGIAHLIKEKYNIEIDTAMLADILAEADSMNRAWRDILLKDESMRGEDYDRNNSKEILEQQKMLELGYSSNWDRDNKQLNLI